MKSKLIVAIGLLLAGVWLAEPIPNAAEPPKNDVANPAEEDVFAAFETARMSAVWNNQISVFLEAKEYDPALTRVSARVAYEVAEIKNLESKLDPDEVENARHLYRTVYPTLKKLKGTRSLMNMPRGREKGINEYFDYMEKMEKEEKR